MFQNGLYRLEHKATENFNLNLFWLGKFKRVKMFACC
jgi:hypothetical protein